MKSSTSRVEIKVLRLSHGMGLPLPSYQTDEASGLDLMAAVPLTAPLRLLPGMRQLVPTGLTLEIPSGFEGQVRPRSGLALNHGVTVLNAPGTIDADYRGELQVLLVNLGRETFVITRGLRIAQLVVQAVARAEMIDVRAVAASRRGDAGFGSTGLAAASETPRVAIAAKPAPAAVAGAPASKAAAAAAKTAVRGPFKSGQARPAPSKGTKEPPAAGAKANRPADKATGKATGKAGSTSEGPATPGPAKSGAAKTASVKRAAPTAAAAKGKAAARA